MFTFVYDGKPIEKLMRLKITPTMRNEWQVRAITDVIPALAKLPWETANVVEVDTTTANEIRAVSAGDSCKAEVIRGPRKP